jgi:CofD-related protein of GAK system
MELPATGVPKSSAGEAAPHIVLFSGGTACRNINIALSRMSMRLTRIVPAWDSGGSSKELREAFDMLPVGDVRQALMTMAHGEGRAGNVVKICNARLSDALGNDEARAELRYYAQGEHPLLQRMEPGLREAILSYLKLLIDRLPESFDFRNGSIGNFILTGAYFAHGEDINTAILKFRELCSIAGNVWPASTLPDVQLAATLRDGRRLERQHLVTRMSDRDAETGVQAIELLSRDVAVDANEETPEALRHADAIVFGPGSFYTSILPHLLVAGVPQAIADNRHAPKIFIGNILECAETRGMDLAAQIAIFSRTADVGPGSLLTHVVSNTELFPFEKTVRTFPYLRHGRLDAICRELGITHVSEDVEDAWTRGHHDGRAVAETLLGLVRAHKSVAASQL